MNEYAKCWVNDLGQRRWQPHKGGYYYWHDYGTRVWRRHKPTYGSPVLFRFRWYAARVARKDARWRAKRNFQTCEPTFDPRHIPDGYSDDSYGGRPEK